VKLTKRVVDALAYERKSAAQDAWDDHTVGFGVRVYPSGRKSFVLSYRAKGRQRFHIVDRTASAPSSRHESLRGTRSSGCDAGRTGAAVAWCSEPPPPWPTRRARTRRSIGTRLLISNQKVGTSTPGVSGNRPLSTARPVIPPETSWDTAILKRLENTFQAMARNSLPLSHLREHPSSTHPYPVLSGNYTTTKAPPADA
jgi:hypothetical protein